MYVSQGAVGLSDELPLTVDFTHPSHAPQIEKSSPDHTPTSDGRTTWLSV